jgi:hypothetical protein
MLTELFQVENMFQMSVNHKRWLFKYITVSIPQQSLIQKWLNDFSADLSEVVFVDWMAFCVFRRTAQLPYQAVRLIP